jgi:hypothetical protein
MDSNENSLINKFKIWSFPLLFSVLSYFGIQTMKKLDEAVIQLQNLNTTITKIEVLQTIQGRDLDKIELRVNRIEQDNTRTTKNNNE